jgi:hypothetical protein
MSYYIKREQGPRGCVCATTNVFAPRPPPEAGAPCPDVMLAGGRCGMVCCNCKSPGTSYGLAMCRDGKCVGQEACGLMETFNAKLTDPDRLCPGDP